MPNRSPDFTSRSAIVRVSDSAIMHLILAGMESFRVRVWGKQVRKNTTQPVETAGLLIGYATHRDNVDHFVVEHASTDKFVKGSSSEVEPLIETVTHEKRTVLRNQWPHLQLIGDFHTHPYTTYSQALAAKGWEFSTADYETYDNNWSPNEWEGRCALVLTIAELKKVHESSRKSNELWEDNVIHWQVGSFRFWLSAIVLDVVEKSQGLRFIASPGKKDCSQTRPNVYINVPTIRGVDRI